MNLLLKNATVVDPNAPNNGQTLDILIANGRIEKMGTGLSDSDCEVVEGQDLYVSPGWFDMHVNFCDPGYEHKEDLQSGCAAAIAGGFTGVALMPSTNPPVDSKSGVEYLLNRTAQLPIDVHPVGALSHGLEGKELAELYDMQQAGAVAFSDDKHSIASSELLKRALMYAQPFNARVLAFPNDASVSGSGQINEGPMSTRLGLKGLPALAEELMVARDLALLEYTGGSLHFSTISTAKSVALIRAARASGLNATAEVAIHNLLLDDTALESFDSNLKVMPPLRSAEDVEALIAGVQDGTIDAIVSDHQPQDTEEKKLEFDRAAFGLIGLQTVYAALNSNLGAKLDQETMVTRLAIGPRKVLNLAVPAVAEGEAANLTIFSPTQTWTFAPAGIRSKSNNSPFVGQTFTGKVLGTVHNGSLQRD